MIEGTAHTTTAPAIMLRGIVVQGWKDRIIPPSCALSNAHNFESQQALQRIYKLFTDTFPVFDFSIEHVKTENV